MKESPRGLKRLLKFGRKKASASTATEWPSISSPSEADEDAGVVSSERGVWSEDSHVTHIGVKGSASRVPPENSSSMCTPAIPEDSPTVAGSESKINSSMWTLQVLSSPVSYPFVCVPWFVHKTYRFRVHMEMFTEKEGYLSRFIHCLTHILGWMQYHL
jgi:hypothetical protein